MQDTEAHDPLPLTQLIEAEEAARIMDAMGCLSAAVREVVVLRFLEGHGYDQIAQQIGRSAHQVRAICHKGVRRLRRELGEEVRHGQR